MTDEVIRKLSEECALYYQGRPSNKGYELSNRLTIESYALMTLRWLSDKFCIVEKELIRKEYAKAQKTHDIYTSATCINEMESRAIDHAEGRMCELNTLFGKEFFNEAEI